MKCHYEILNVPRDVNDEELKKAYRKLALKWHPDKNLENVTESKEMFQLIQQAYDILSDPQERSWYDKHRDSILKGGVGSDYKDDSLNVYQYFTTTCYKGYSDCENGFYMVYQEVFNKIAAEDSEYETNMDSDFEIPNFGSSQSSYEEVVHVFYSYWQSYTTKKSYSWLDIFDIRSAPNRRIVRMMEKENKKIRDKARKERNEEVRALVAFVRKRDRRVQAYSKLLEERAAENVKKAEDHRRKQLLERKMAMSSYTETEWAKFSNLESELKEIEASLAAEFSDSENESIEENSLDCLYCVACNKNFKTSKAFSNHENSKKHKENTELLKLLMQADDTNITDDVCEVNGEESFQESENSDSQDSTDHNRKLNCFPKATNSNHFDIKEESCLNNSDCDIKANTNVEQTESDESDLDSTLNQFEKSTINLDSENSDTEINFSDFQSKRQKKKSFNIVSTESNIIESTSSNKNKGKKAKKKKLSQSAISDKSETKALKSEPLEDKSEHLLINHPSAELNKSCVTCNTSFKSKNELFKHLKNTGHAVFVPAETRAKSFDERNTRGKKNRKKV